MSPAMAGAARPGDVWTGRESAPRAHRAPPPRALLPSARPPRFAARRVSRSPSSARAIFPARVRNCARPASGLPSASASASVASRARITSRADAHSRRPSAREMSACSRASLGRPSRGVLARPPARSARRPSRRRAAPLPRRAVSGDNASGVGASDARFDVDGLPDDFSDADPRAPGAPRPRLRPTTSAAPNRRTSPHRRRPARHPHPRPARAQRRRHANLRRPPGRRHPTLGRRRRLGGVVALDVRPGNSPLDAIGGAVDHVLMSSLRQVGDVVLVHDESAVERRWSARPQHSVAGCDVVTERGVYIGRVRDYEFDPEDGLVQRLVVDALGLPVVPEGVVEHVRRGRVGDSPRRDWTASSSPRARIARRTTHGVAPAATATHRAAVGRGPRDVRGLLRTGRAQARDGRQGEV